MASTAIYCHVPSASAMSWYRLLMVRLLGGIPIALLNEIAAVAVGPRNLSGSACSARLTKVVIRNES